MSRGGNAVNTNYEVLLEKQLENLEAIQKKIDQLQPGNPSQELLEAVYLELGRALNQISEIKTRQEESEQNLEKKKSFQQEEEIRQQEQERYREEKEHLLALIKFRDFENVHLKKDLSQLSGWMRSLRKNTRALLKSRGWKLGSALAGTVNRLRFKQNKQVSAKQIMQVLSEFEEWEKQSLKLHQQEKASSTVDADYDLLVTWLENLKVKTGLLLRSRRWKLVNLLGSLALGPLGRGKTPQQVKRIEHILTKFENLSLKNKKEDVTTLSSWIEDYERNYWSLVNSKRWKISDKIFSSINLILSRKQDNLATVAIEDILARFQEWKQKQ